jgi:hypothetical protein
MVRVAVPALEPPFFGAVGAEPHAHQHQLRTGRDRRGRDARGAAVAGAVLRDAAADVVGPPQVVLCGLAVGAQVVLCGLAVGA